MRVLIACAGPDTKWGNHLGVPRHLVPMDGEPLLHRTVRQALKVSTDVHVISGTADERYNLPGTSWHVSDHPTPNEFLSSRTWWSHETRTLLLLGDTYYTDAAMETIAGFAPERWQLFGRKEASALTGKPWGEYFACSWWPKHTRMMLENLEQVLMARRVGIAQRCGGWELLRSIQRTPLNDHIVQPHWFSEIDDLTDDLDFPVDVRHPAVTVEVAGV